MALARFSKGRQMSMQEKNNTYRELTLQGLPKDNIVTEEWHLQDCQKEDKCPCKKKIKITENDFGLSLLEMTNEEKICWDRFQKVLVWGNVQLWRKRRHS